MTQHIAFVDLVKAFDLVSRSGLFQLLKKIGCPPMLLSFAVSFHNQMHFKESYNGASSDSFKIFTLFGIFFSVLLNFVFHHFEEEIYLHSRSDGKLFSLSSLKAKSKVRTVLLKEMLFADNAALISHTEEGLQDLIYWFPYACKEFGLTISIKKTNVMGQNVPAPPSITINNEVLEVTDHFTYLGSTVISNLPLDTEIDKRIAKAAAVLSN